MTEWDFTNDGYEIKTQHGRVFCEKREPILKSSTNSTLIIGDINKYILTNKLRECYDAVIDSYNPPCEECEMKTIKISDYFEYVGRGNVKISGAESGEYPLISSTTANNGIVKYVNSFKFDGTYITFNANGDCGHCFCQYGKFNTTGNVIVLKPKTLDDELEFIATCMTLQLRRKYSWSHKLSKLRLMSESFQIPINYRPPRIDVFELKRAVMSSLSDVNGDGENGDCHL